MFCKQTLSIKICLIFATEKSDERKLKPKANNNLSLSNSAMII